MGDKSEKKQPEIPDSDAKNKGSCGSDREPTSPGKPLKSVSDYVKKFFSKLYGGGAAPAANGSRSAPSPSNITALISAVEKRIKEFYEAVAKRVTNFLENDLRQLKDTSKDEITKMNSSLSEYRAQLEKISQEKITRIAEIKSQLKTRLMTAEEVQSFVKYIDDRMTEIKKITESMIETMRKNEAANNFAKDLQSTVTDYSKRVTSALDGLYNALKHTAGDLSRSMPDRKTIMTKIPKMPTTSELQRMPSVVGKVLKKIGAASTKPSGKSGEKPTLPISLREKLSGLNLGKHFNSQTIYGRANVAKATYATAFLTFLYWKFRHSRS